MKVGIYCFKRGLFIKKKFIKSLQNELQKEFGESVKNNRLYLDNLICSLDKDYNSYFKFTEPNSDLDKLIKIIILVSKKYEITLGCDVTEYDERELVNHIRMKVKNTNIDVIASLTL